MIDGFNSFMLSFDSSEDDLLHVIGENTSELLAHSFGAINIFTSGFIFVFTFGILLPFTLLKASFIRLSGLFFFMMKFQTVFFVSHFPISDTPHLKSRVAVFSSQDIISHAHSIAEND